MDNLTHTLFGAALGMAGLRRKTGLGLATLMIAANLPDLDALGLLVGENLAWRRGWTHGPIALVVLPLLLTLAIVGYDRFQTRRNLRPVNRAPVRGGWVLALAYIGIASHPFLDFLNTYGIRCLAPFSDRWFYGDTLFIVDPWVWLLLATGLWLSWRSGRAGESGTHKPAFVSLLLTVAYAGLMSAGTQIAENHAERAIVAQGFSRPERILASPVPIDPFSRRLVFETDQGYGFGTANVFARPMLALEPKLVPTGMNDPAIGLAASQDKRVADFLFWSRYPFATVRQTFDGTRVVIGDARYGREPGNSRFNVQTFLTDTTPETRPTPPVR